MVVVKRYGDHNKMFGIGVKFSLPVRKFTLMRVLTYERFHAYIDFIAAVCMKIPTGSLNIPTHSTYIYTLRRFD